MKKPWSEPLNIERNKSTPSWSSNDEFGRYVGALLRAKWLLAFLGVIFAASELAATSPRQGMVATDLGLAAFGLAVIWYYEYHATSVHALLLMADGIAVSFSLLLPLGIGQEARTLGRNYWLFLNYRYWYVGAWVVLFLYLLLFPDRESKNGMQRQISALSFYATRGEISSKEFYDVLMSRRGAKETMRKWTSARYTAILGPISICFIALTTWKGGDSMLYACFLLSLPLAPFLIAPRIRRRVLLIRELGSRDIAIVPCLERQST